MTNRPATNPRDDSPRHNDHEPITIRAGEVLFNQGDEGDQMYALVAGMLGVRIRHADGRETEIDRLAPGALFGEMAAQGGGRRTATIYAVVDSAVMPVNPGSAMMAGVALDVDELDARWQRLQLAEILARVLGPLSAVELHTLQNELTWRHLAGGEVLLRQGDAPDGMYIIVNGRLRAGVELPDGTQELRNEMGAGETVGEYALLTDRPRGATVYAARESNVVHMPTATFDRLARENPMLMRHIAQLVIEREATPPHRAPAERPQSIAVVPASATVDARRFAEELAAALSLLGTTTLLDAAGFDERFGTPGAAQTERTDPAHLAIVAWLDELERANRFVVFVTEQEPTAWTRRALDHVDRVLVVADPAGDPAPGPVEQLLAGRELPLRTDLALWHPAGTAWPSGTAAWLDARAVATRPVEAHYHVRRDTPAHMARLARRLAGEAVGLVFSGGGALAYADMGVFQAMQELAIPIDYVGGASMGAITAGAVACEMSLDEMAAGAAYTAETGVFDPTLPLAALNRSENVTRITQHLFGSHNIEDLWLPYFCVSTSLSLAERVIHRRGPLWRAIRASMAIPGVFLPVVEDGNVLIDGGIIDNFPAGLMATLSGSPRIIGIHVSPYKVRLREYDYDTSLSGWKLLASRLNPFSRSLRAPSLAYMMMRAAELNGVRLGREDEALVDLLITPDVSGFRNTDYDAWEAIARTGYDAAFQPLRRWKATTFGDSAGDGGPPKPC